MMSDYLFCHPNQTPGSSLNLLHQRLRPFAVNVNVQTSRLGNVSNATTFSVMPAGQNRGRIGFVLLLLASIMTFVEVDCTDT